MLCNIVCGLVVFVLSGLFRFSLVYYLHSEDWRLEYPALAPLRYLDVLSASIAG